MSWYAVRSVLRYGGGDYDERITLWEADDVDAAIALAEAEVAEQCETLECTAAGLIQTFWLFDEPGHGVEVFSLLRRSDLEPAAYVERFFDTGAESTYPEFFED